MSLTEAATLLAFGVEEDADQWNARRFAAYVAGEQGFKEHAIAAEHARAREGLPDNWREMNYNMLTGASVLPRECRALLEYVNERDARFSGEASALWRAAMQIIEAGEHDELELRGRYLEGRDQVIPSHALANLKTLTDPGFLDRLCSRDISRNDDWEGVRLKRSSFQTWLARKEPVCDDDGAPFPVPHEQRAISVVANALKEDGESIRPKAHYFDIIDAMGLRVSGEAKEKRVWPRAREAAGLSVRAKAGRRKSRTLIADPK